VAGILTGGIQDLLGGRVLVEENPAKAAAAMVAHIDQKRLALGI
jgi:carbon-monoxide dehydrogenase catalytic subunit